MTPILVSSNLGTAVSHLQAVTATAFLPPETNSRLLCLNHIDPAQFCRDGLVSGQVGADSDFGLSGNSYAHHDCSNAE
jgi:hypothetical protein